MEGDGDGSLLPSVTVCLLFNVLVWLFSCSPRCGHGVARDGMQFHAARKAMALLVKYSRSSDILMAFAYAGDSGINISRSDSPGQVGEEKEASGASDRRKAFRSYVFRSSGC